MLNHKKQVEEFRKLSLQDDEQVQEFNMDPTLFCSLEVKL